MTQSLWGDVGQCTNVWIESELRGLNIPVGLYEKGLEGLKSGSKGGLIQVCPFFDTLYKDDKMAAERGVFFT